ncbi:MAG: tRNA 5-methoxyuridine(34)/uridine 5-oxyacetic acid(34) synthase CmoB [Methylococcaceae bacterium]|nr:tRNA 5-methoxyuridine(34)/uridine 5-oxyacetic acid(34) synthase CmoB [Methylococcaceae bacterium]MDZ4156752.1 tRNA 5-methoxyuridine(34)/uridine 5-oxyacetic acid(34) synthase CmoB [Methylococcales bacterium]MDP2393344.1 tRNA 5-methoxyuridine(34)/uridine 5-oxyacetic acid(34) synthase CmoB [Methylococcaceae bacterium]MDP3018335.1 tRNA 5-methoxyuridine(34)/uridine 5-oxyacetic acid(34) synthase CmoB [Methylococcaceae bacterium]MDP3388553.1 tRNA 5-methoxyuridine(34)/uridine 5-oxyacetic acid(34) sy
MIDYQPLYQALLDAKADDWANQLPEQLLNALSQNRHGTLSQWQAMIADLPTFDTSHRLLDADTVQIGRGSDLSINSQILFESQLKTLLPWRKGPYDLFGVHIDTEWRSDWKWNRLKDHISPLQQRMVLDVGCGNGYHCWRMLGAGARMVIGVDPLLLNVMQFQLIRKLYGEAPIYVLPVGIEDIPPEVKAFDTVFSMGVLYHRRSPIDHLLELKACLKPGGELVLETLIIDGGVGETLLPEDRYAKMRNVWFLPSVPTLINWLARCGFNNIRVVDVTVTSTEEQRSTEWMPFHSLKNFLNSDNLDLTCEGLPAPKRAIVIANVP